MEKDSDEVFMEFGHPKDLAYDKKENSPVVSNL